MTPTPSDREIAERIWEDWKRPSSSHDNDIVDMIERALSAARRDVRAAAIEECAKMVETCDCSHLLAYGSEIKQLQPRIAAKLRAFLPTPEPTQEPDAPVPETEGEKP